MSSKSQEAKLLNSPALDLFMSCKIHKNAGGLPEVFGDGLLYKKNAIFRSVRQLALKRYRIRFVDNQFNFSHVLNHLSLRDMMKTNSIQTWKNTNSIFKFLQKQGPSFTVERLLKSRLHFDYLLHESTHLVYDHIWRQTFHLKGYLLEEDALGILRIYLGESVAVAAELLAAVECKDATEKVVLGLSTSGAPSAHDLKLLRQASAEIGHRTVFIILVLGILNAMMLKTSLRKNDAEWIARICATDSKFSFALAKKIVLLGQGLDKDFIQVTGDQYFQLLGEKTRVRKKLRLNPFKFIAQSVLIQNTLSRAHSELFSHLIRAQ